jgi:ABC-2 type transport system ATP-binding protein
MARAHPKRRPGGAGINLLPASPAYHGAVTASEQPLIDAAGVTKRFGHVTALDGVTATVTSPALGLLGANGAGKSTFMKAMLGLVKPDAGKVKVLGMDAAHQAREIRRSLGYMPENMCLPLGMTARDFIVHMGELRGLPRRIAVLRASEVLFQVGLEEERSRLIRTFSIGMRQRTNLAQAIVHSPSMVILDEPTNGLDPSGREEMLTLVRRLSAELGIAVIMSSHVLEDVVRTCDAVVVLREGRLAATRTLADAAATSEREARVVVSGDAAAFAAHLQAAGISAAVRDDHVLVSGPDADSMLRAVRDAAADTGTGLHELRPAGPTLEDALIGDLT